MTKYFKLEWQRDVPEALQLGAMCDRWTEVIKRSGEGVEHVNRQSFGTSVTRLGNLLDFGQLFKAFGNN